MRASRQGRHGAGGQAGTAGMVLEGKQAGQAWCWRASRHGRQGA